VPDLLDAYADVVHDRGGRLPGAYGAARELAHRIGRALPLSRPVPCHDDLLPANVLHVGDGGIMLIDWEYAGMGHGMFDVANLAAGADLDEQEESRLLAAYVERKPSFGDHAALRLMRIMSDAREAAWGVVQQWISDLDFDFAAYADRHFRRMAAVASDPRLQEWLDAAAT
jgi:thiamine kinase-like enzyme